MVGTRWESSNRPLFVRTVWKDGHHHVVLRKDEEAKAQTARSARRNLSSSRCSKKTSPSADPGASFKVPSVKLLLASLRNFRPDSKIKRCKTETREFVRSAITFDIIPSDTVRYNDLNKQVSFKNEKPNPKLSTKSNSLDVSHFYSDKDSSIATPPPFSYDTYWMEQFNTSLSERVMIWLDLAIQNDKQFQNADLKKRVMTAKACPIFHREKKNVEKTEIGREENNKEKDKVETIVPFVTSQMEYDQIEKIRQTFEEKKPMRVSTVKRQLHIFLPNLPKKSDSGSFLSSKSSSFKGK